MPRNLELSGFSGAHHRAPFTFSELDHHLDGFSVIHYTVAIGNTVDAGDTIEHEPIRSVAIKHLFARGDDLSL